MIALLPVLLGLLVPLLMWAWSARDAARTLAKQSTPLHDPGIKAITDRFAQALDQPGIHVAIHEIEPVNGLAAPDGRIYLTRGFYDRYRQGHVSAEEIASVIAHELGHVALGHTRKRMIDFSGQNAVFVSLVALILRAIPVVGPLIAMLMARTVTGALAAHLSRADEYAADEWATALLMKVGIGPEPQISLFRKLDAMTGGPQAPAWLLSHPRTADRIQAIRDNHARWNG